MVKALKGSLITTEQSIHEIILKIGENENFLIEDIDDTTLFLDQSCKNTIKGKVNKILNATIKKPEQ